MLLTKFRAGRSPERLKHLLCRLDRHQLPSGRRPIPLSRGRSGGEGGFPISVVLRAVGKLYGQVNRMTLRRAGQRRTVA